jgi:hypothetical protein
VRLLIEVRLEGRPPDGGTLQGDFGHEYLP